MSERKASPEAMFELATQLRAAAQRQLPKTVGITIIVHDAVLTVNGSIALDTTLPSRLHTQALLANALVESSIAEGAESPEDISRMARAAFRILEQGEPAKPKARGDA